jgi:hypothetical protein
MWPSAVGLQPQDNVFYNHTYPWVGLRIGVVGEPTTATRATDTDR